MSRLSRGSVWLVASLLSFGSACGGGGAAKSGCTKDTDCKGDRVCQSGACVEGKAAPGAIAAQQVPAQPQPAAPQPAQPMPAQPMPDAPQPVEAPAADPYAMAADGLPVFIPPPGSAAPTTEEWNAVPREVTVRGSSALGCETKMLREWLRVTCRTHAGDYPISVRSTVLSPGIQAFVFTGDGVTSAVTQVAPGREYRAAFVWSTEENHWEAELIAAWPGGAPRPTFYFEVAGGD